MVTYPTLNQLDRQRQAHLGHWQQAIYGQIIAPSSARPL